MRMRMQNTNNAAVMNRVRTYDGMEEALLLMTSEDREIEEALNKIFRIHGALMVDPEGILPFDEPDFGDCKIGDNGVLLTIEGSGGSFMGMRHDVRWGPTSAEWRAHAERRGCVWLGLVKPKDYARVSEGGQGERLPLMRVLKLEVSP